MEIDLFELPSAIPPGHLAGRVAVLFDILRATTTMTAALAVGIQAIHLFGDVISARAAAGEAAERPLLAGEVGCLRPEGFDLGNSPRDLTKEMGGKTLFMSTTNGTRAVLAAAEAKLLLIGSLLNADAVAKVAARSQLPVSLICAGTDGTIAMEDLIGAGAVISGLQKSMPLGQRLEPRSDLARLSLPLFDVTKRYMENYLAQSTGGQNIIAAGLTADITFAAQLNRFPQVVGQVKNGVVRRMSLGF